MSTSMNAIAQTSETRPVSPRRHLFQVAAVLLLVIGAALRVYHLGDRSLWFDEALTANTSRGTLMQMLEETRARCSAPIVHPFILYLVQKASGGPTAVRMPSVLASLLAVLAILATVRAKVSFSAALFSATILTVSASQVRYAQEVREYSLAVLWGAILIYCLLRWEVAGSPSRHPVLLYVTLFLAPLIQYGLVFLALGILSTIVLRLLLTPDRHFRPSHVAAASVFLTAGGLLSFVLTLRYQFVPGRGHSYLAPNYFDPQTTNLVHFISANSRGLLSFFIPGQVISAAFVFAAAILCIAQILNRKVDSIVVLVFTTVSITICASVVGIYPYGGVRQCLFLAPLLVLLAGVAFADLLRRLRDSLQPAVTVALIAVIFFQAIEACSASDRTRNTRTP